MGVSKNNGTPKSSILIGFSIINHPFWGTPIFGNIHIDFLTECFVFGDGHLGAQHQFFCICCFEISSSGREKRQLHKPQKFWKTFGKHDCVGSGFGMICAIVTHRVVELLLISELFVV